MFIDIKKRLPSLICKNEKLKEKQVYYAMISDTGAIISSDKKVFST